MNSNWSYSPETPKSGQNRSFFRPVWSWNLTADPQKTTGYIIYATASFVHHLLTNCKFKLELQSGNPQIMTKFVFASVTLTFHLWLWPFEWTSPFSMVISAENFMMIRWQKTLWKGCNRWTDGRTHRSVVWPAWSQLKQCRFIVILTLGDKFQINFHRSITNVIHETETENVICRNVDDFVWAPMS